MEPRRPSLGSTEPGRSAEQDKPSSPITVRNNASTSTLRAAGSSTLVSRRLTINSQAESSISSSKGFARSGYRDSSAQMLDPALSSYASYSLPCSIDTANYSDSMYGSPLMYGESFVDHQNLQQMQYQEEVLEQEQRQQEPEQQGHGLIHEEYSQHRRSLSRDVSLLSFHTDYTERGPPVLPPLLGGRNQLTRSSSTSSNNELLGRSIATASQLSSQRHLLSSGRSYGDLPLNSQPNVLNEQNLATESTSAGSSVNDIAAQGSFIMPTISTNFQDAEQAMHTTAENTWDVQQEPMDSPSKARPPKIRSSQRTPSFGSDQSRPYSSRRASTQSVSRLLHSQPRMMSPSPVPMHARLSKLQKNRERRAKVPESFDCGQSMLPSGQTYPSRRHSIAEEDVCFPPDSTDLEVDYGLLEEYLEKEKGQTQENLHGIEPNAPWRNFSFADRPGSTRTDSSTSRLFSKHRRSIHYGSISDPPFELPRNFGLLYHAQEISQTITEGAFRFTLFSTSSVTVHAKSLFELAPLGQTLTEVLNSGFFWLDILTPTDGEVRTLSQVFKIHPLTTEDILMQEGREKCEVFLNYYFVCFRTFVLESDSAQVLQPSSIYMLILPDGVISFHLRPIQHCRNVRKRIRHLKEKLEVTPDWVNYAMIDDIVDGFAPLIRQVEAEVDMIDELVLMLKEADQPDMLRRIGNCRKRVMSLLRLLTGKADVIKGLIKRYEGKVGHKGTGEIGLFLGDIQDHIITMIQNLSHCEKILSRSHSNYLAQINIEMTAASNETNNVLTKLTAIGSIMLPMNLVTGLWGMNVHVPGQGTESLAWFFSIVTAILCTASMFVFIARKTKLL